MCVSLDLSVARFPYGHGAPAPPGCVWIRIHDVQANAIQVFEILTFRREPTPCRFRRLTFRPGIQANIFQASAVQAKDENKFSKVGKMNLRLYFLIGETKGDSDRSYSLLWTN